MTENFPSEPVSDHGAGHTAPIEESAASERQMWPKLILLAAVLMAIIATMFWGTFFGLQQLLDPQPPTGKNNLAPIAENGNQNAAGDPATSQDREEPEEELEGNPSVDKLEQLRIAEEQAVRTAKLEEFTNLRDEVQQGLDNLATELSSWNQLLEEMLDKERGKNIASDPAYIEQFLSIQEQDYVTQQQYESWIRRLKPLSESINKAIGHASYLPSEKLLNELIALQKEVSAAAGEITRARGDVEAIERFAATRPKSDQTLGDAIRVFRAEQQKARLDQIAATRRQAEEETTAILANKEAEQEELRREVELARIASKNDELRASKRRLDAEAKEAEARRRREEAKAALVRQFEAEYPAMKSMLTPFTSTGTRQPTTSFQYIDTGERKPVSFGALQRLGYLENSPQNRLYFAKYVTALNNRPTGSFPNLSLDAGGGHEKIRKIQEFLQKYGEIMVEKELLSP